MLNKFSVILLILISAGQVLSQTNQCGDADKFPKLTCKITRLNLIDENNPVEIKVYTKASRNFRKDRTFVVVHNNEEKGLYAVKEVLSESGFGGRLVEVKTNYQKSYSDEGFFHNRGNEGRYLHFGNGKFCVDPNRIYSAVGQMKALIKAAEEACPETPKDDDTIKKLGEFADKLISIVTSDGKHKFIIGVHNNTEPGGLDITDWLLGGSESNTAIGILGTNYHNKSKGLTKDDFILVSNLALFKSFFDLNNPFAFSIALQEEKNYLTDQNGKVKEDYDDGSMSIYFGAKSDAPNVTYSYINIEAGGKANKPENVDSSKKWQKQMIRKAIRVKI